MIGAEAEPIDHRFAPSCVIRPSSRGLLWSSPTILPLSSRIGEPLLPGREVAVLRNQSPSTSMTSPSLHFLSAPWGWPTAFTCVPMSDAASRFANESWLGGVSLFPGLPE